MAGRRGEGFSFSRSKAARLSAAKARALGKSPDKGPGLFTRLWDVGELWWKRCSALVLNLIGTAALVFICVLLWQAINQRVIAIAPISVPESLAKAGFTADVAAQRLESALNRLVKEANSLKDSTGVAMQGDQPKITVPVTGVPLEALADSLRGFLSRGNRNNVAGDIVLAEGKLWLRLRMNGKDLYASTDGAAAEHPDDLFAKAAEKIFEDVDPYILAASLKKTDPDRSLEICDRLVTALTEKDTRPWVYLLIGAIFEDRHKFTEAEASSRKAIAHNNDWSFPHNSLGIALANQGKNDAAIAEFRIAMLLDPLYARPHNNLGAALAIQGKIDAAIAEYRIAMSLDPNDAQPHNNLGNALMAQGKIDAAIGEYGTAISLDPKDADYHHNLSIALDRLGKNAEAQAERDKAQALETAAK